MENVLLFGDGPLRVQGFATLFGVPASTEDGTVVLRPGAFAASLKSGARDIVATFGHDFLFTWAGTADNTLRLWEAPSGLAFEANVESSLRGAGLADYVAAGAAACSITYVALDCLPTATGCEVLRADLEEICIFTEGALPTACWLAGDAQPPGSLTPRGENLRRRWLTEQQARRTYAAPAASARPRARSARRAQPSMSFAEYAGEPPAGITAKDWQWFADMDAAGRRVLRASRRARGR